MSLGNEMPYRRSRRGPEATGSLVFDQERRKHQEKAAETPGDLPARGKDFRKAQVG